MPVEASDIMPIAMDSGAASPQAVNKQAWDLMSVWEKESVWMCGLVFQPNPHCETRVLEEAVEIRVALPSNRHEKQIHNRGGFFRA